MPFGTTLTSLPELTDDNSVWPQPPQQQPSLSDGGGYWLPQIARGLWNTVKSGFTLPGDVATGKASMSDPATQARVGDMASLVMGGGIAGPAEADALNSGLRAFHASPHNFDRFSMEHLGTGEGAQVYGRGLYFAQNPDVMEQYFRNFSQRRIDPNSPAGMAKGILAALPDREAAIKELQGRIDYSPKVDPRFKVEGWLDKANAAMDLLKSDWDPYKNAHRYEVQINTHPDRLLDWDRPLSQQPYVKDIVQSFVPLQKRYGEPGSPAWEGVTGEMAYRKAHQAGYPGGMIWTESGIPGVKYADQFTRGGSPELETKNYAIWNDKIINIMKKYGIGALGTAGAGDAMMHMPNQQQAPVQ